jgi:cyanate lyase
MAKKIPAKKTKTSRTEDDPQFSRPAKPLSFKEVVKRILSDSAYAKFFHGEVVKARQGDRLAAENVAEHFKLQPKELKELKLPSAFGKCDPRRCTDTDTNLYLFEFAMPAQIWPKDKAKKD